MEYVSLYRRFRPDTFDKVVGQDHIVRTLTNQIESNRIGHAYLFTGARGTGKTSCAKIFARAVNCLTPAGGSPCGKCSMCRALENSENIDIIEIDAASNSRVDDVRDLTENTRYRPAVCRYKVYIIDEVHELSDKAYNALLKTLEEPPEYIIFILATTEVQKLPRTILSRCMRFDFRLVGEREIAGLLRRIFSELNVEYEEEALSVIAVNGEGSVRDALSIADMCLSYGGGKILLKDVIEIIGGTSFKALNELGCAILSGNAASALGSTNDLLSAGRTTLIKELSRYFTEVLNVKNIENYTPSGVAPEERRAMFERAKECSNFRLARILDIFAELETAARYSAQPSILIETAVVKACEPNREKTPEGLSARMEELEKRCESLEKSLAVTAGAGSAAASAAGERIPQASLSPEKESKPAAGEIPPVNTEERDIREGSSSTGESESTSDVPAPEGEDSESKSESTADILKRMERRLHSVIGSEGGTVFFENHESADGLSAEGLWEKLTDRVFAGGDDLLKMATRAFKGSFFFGDGNFIATTTDAASITLFTKPKNKKYFNELLSDITGKPCSFDCVYPPENKVAPDDLITLDKIFAGDLEIKNK